MTLAPRRNSTFADLLRLTAGWLVVVLALQSLQWAGSLGGGPRHRHGTALAAAGESSFEAAAHRHAHAAAERHHHAPGDASVWVQAADRELDEALERAAFALAAAFGLLAFAHTRRAALPGRHVLRAAVAAAWRSAERRRRARPPRRA